MSRELLILRHAKSAWNTDAPSDFERPLSKRGRKAAPRVGRWLLEQGLVPDYVVSSPAKRAKQTVIAVCAELGVEPDLINWNDHLYGAWTPVLVGVLAQSPASAGRVMIAGHNPGLESLVEHLCREPVPMPYDHKLLPTAALARLEIDCEWRDLTDGTARLHSITRARSLKDY